MLPNHSSNDPDPRIAILRAVLEHHRHFLNRAMLSVPASARDTWHSSDEWSVAAVLEHLLDTERAVTKLVRGFVADAAERENGAPFDRDAFDRQVDLPLFLDLTQKIRGPQPSGTLTADEAWAGLRASRAALLAELQRAQGRKLEIPSLPHPVTGTDLNGYQWVAFVGLHEGRHAMQIRKIALSFATESREHT